MKLPRKAFSLPVLDSTPFHEASSIGLARGQEAPVFVAETLNGEKVTLATYSGQSILFLFFAPSDFCRETIAECVALLPKAAAASVTIVFVSSTGLQPTFSFVNELCIRPPVLIAPRASNPFLCDYNISDLPSYCLINPQGKIQSMGGIGKGWNEWKTLVESWVRSESSVIDDKPVGIYD